MLSFSGMQPSQQGCGPVKKKTKTYEVCDSLKMCEELSASLMNANCSFGDRQQKETVSTCKLTDSKTWAAPPSLWMLCWSVHSSEAECKETCQSQATWRPGFQICNLISHLQPVSCDCQALEWKPNSECSVLALPLNTSTHEVEASESL